MYIVNINKIIDETIKNNNSKGFVYFTFSNFRIFFHNVCQRFVALRGGVNQEKPFLLLLNFTSTTEVLFYHLTSHLAKPLL